MSKKFIIFIGILAVLVMFSLKIETVQGLILWGACCPGGISDCIGKGISPSCCGGGGPYGLNRWICTVRCGSVTGTDCYSRGLPDCYGGEFADCGVSYYSDTCQCSGSIISRIYTALFCDPFPSPHCSSFTNWTTWKDCGTTTWTSDRQCASDNRWLQAKRHYYECQGPAGSSSCSNFSCIDYIGDWQNYQDCCALAPDTCYYLDPWGPDYCSADGDLWHDTARHDLSCATNACQDTTSTVSEIVKDCPIYCSECDPSLPDVWVDPDPNSVTTTWQNEDATAYVGCSDSESGCDPATYQLQISTSPLGACSPFYSDYTADDATMISSHSWVCAAAKDYVGNTGFSSPPVEFKVDQEAPESIIDSPPESPNPDNWQNDDFLVSVTDCDEGGSGIDPGACTYGVWDTGVGDWTVPLSTYRDCSDSFLVTVGSGADCQTEGTGTCIVYVQSYDRAGNSGGSSRAFSINWTGPTTTIECNDGTGWASCGDDPYLMSVDVRLVCSPGGSPCQATFYCNDRDNTCNPDPCP